MNASFLEFRIINDVQQYLDPTYFKNGPWVHHATLKRRNKEYIVFRQASTNKLYVEYVEANRANLILKRIEDDEEWQDAVDFCEAAGLLKIGGEIKAADPNFMGYFNANKK